MAGPTEAGLLDEVPTRALAVYAHPGDPEVSCGGTLACWAAAGCAVMVVLVAAGDKGTTDPTVDPVELTRRRAAEAAESAAILGVAELELLGHSDGALAEPARLTEQLVGLVRRWKPSTVVCPDPTAVLFGDGYVNHADHRGVGWAALDAVAPAASLPLYFPAQGPPHEVGTMLLSGTLQPDVWVDVAGSVTAKSAAMGCHASQLGTDGPAWVDDVVRGRLEEEGRRVGVRWAEGFRRVRLR